MRHTASLTAGAALLLVAACQPSTKPQPLTAADSTAIVKVRTDYAAAWNRGNVDGVARLYTDDAVFQQADTTALKGATASRAYLNSHQSKFHFAGHGGPRERLDQFEHARGATQSPYE